MFLEKLNMLKGAPTAKPPIYLDRTGEDIPDLATLPHDGIHSHRRVLFFLQERQDLIFRDAHGLVSDPVGQVLNAAFFAEIVDLVAEASL